MAAALPNSICIVGLGLMGGSLALALADRPVRVTAVDRDPAVCAAALAGGVVTAATTDFAAGVADVDLVVLATPARVILHLLAQLRRDRPAGCHVLDLGSTKREIVMAMDALPPAFQAIGGHPMCGREKGGLAMAAADLYQDQTFVLCRSQRTTPQLESWALALIAAIGARPLWLAPARHDELVAVTSHLPYLLSALLLGQAAEAAQADPQLWSVAASGFRDTGRLAGSDPRMMLDILLTNRPALAAQLAAYRAELDQFIDLLAQGDAVVIRDWLTARQAAYETYRRGKAAPAESEE